MKMCINRQGLFNGKCKHFRSTDVPIKISQYRKYNTFFQGHKLMRKNKIHKTIKENYKTIKKNIYI